MLYSKCVHVVIAYNIVLITLLYSSKVLRDTDFIFHGSHLNFEQSINKFPYHKCLHVIHSTIVITVCAIHNRHSTCPTQEPLETSHSQWGPRQRRGWNSLLRDTNTLKIQWVRKDASRLWKSRMIILSQLYYNIHVLCSGTSLKWTKFILTGVAFYKVL